MKKKEDRGGKNSQSLPRRLRSCSTVIEEVLKDIEDDIRTAFYENLMKDLQAGTEDYDSGPVPEISDVLHLTSDPLARQIGHRISTVADLMNDAQHVLNVIRTVGDNIDVQYPNHRRMRYIGAELARIGEEINQNYGHTFQELIDSLEVNDYTVFREVSSRLFSDGTITWGRIAALFVFGYRLALRALSISIQTLFYRLQLYRVGRSIRDWMTILLIARAPQRTNHSRLSQLKKVAYVAIPVIGVLAGVIYLKR